MSKIVHDIVQTSDPKIMATAGGSLVSWAVSVSEQFGPVIDVMAGIVAIGAGLLAMTWTLMKMWDRYEDRKNR